MATKETLDTIEKTLDGIEETLDTIERIPKVNLNGTTKKQQVIILTVTAVVSLAAGSGVTYLVLNKKLKTKYEQLAEKEIGEAKDHYRIMAKQDEFKDPETALEHLTKKVGDLGYAESGAELANKTEEVAEGLEGVADEVREISESQQTEPLVHNVFADHRKMYPHFDYAVELSKRSSAYPYVITEEEYFQNEKEYDQQELTYFAGDGMLVDERESPIEGSDAAVGDANLARFGHGTRDPNMLYVRNEALEIEFAIARSKRTYNEEVLGIEADPELTHADHRGAPRRFRDRDG